MVQVLLRRKVTTPSVTKEKSQNKLITLFRIWMLQYPYISWEIMRGETQRLLVRQHGLIYRVPQIKVRIYLLPWTSPIPRSCSQKLHLLLYLVAYSQRFSFSVQGFTFWQCSEVCPQSLQMMTPGRRPTVDKWFVKRTCS